MKAEDIRCRDPFVVRNGKEYLLFRSHDGILDGHEGVDVFRSRDGREWEGPAPALSLPDRGNTYWAPEAHPWEGAWYLFVTVTGLRPGCGNETPLGKEIIRGTCIFRAEHAEGPYLPWSEGPVTPWEDLALDGTLYADPSGHPFMIYCHEWLQTVDGTVDAVPLSMDLKRRIGESRLLFRASDAPWCLGQYVEEAVGIHFGGTVRVTDGPFAFRDLSGGLCLLWSTANQGKYQTGLARSAGGLFGPWEHADQPLYADDGGHAMLLMEDETKGKMILHQPNTAPDERMRMLPIHLTGYGFEREDE